MCGLFHLGDNALRLVCGPVKIGIEMSAREVDLFHHNNHKAIVNPLCMEFM